MVSNILLNGDNTDIGL